LKTGSYDLVVDTYAWIEYFRGTRIGEKVKAFLAEAERIYTPTIVLAEIARKYIREGVDIKTIEQRLNIIEELSTLISVNREIALRAGKAYLELLEHSEKLGLKAKPSLGDAIILATARVYKAKVLTGDQHFKGLEATVWIGEYSWREP